jgi:hypothetical protein
LSVGFRVSLVLSMIKIAPFFVFCFFVVLIVYHKNNPRAYRGDETFVFGGELYLFFMNETSQIYQKRR